MGEREGGGERETSWWRLAERAAEPLTRSRRRATFIGLGLLFAALLLLAVLGSLEQVLRDLHPPGGEPQGTSALANDLFSGPSEDHVREVLRIWKAQAQAADASLTRIIAVYAIADILFVVVYTLLVGMLLSLLKQELGPGSAGSDELDLTPYRLPVEIALVALGFLALVDLIENAFILVSPLIDFAAEDRFRYALGLWLAFRLKLVLALLVVVPGIVAALTYFAQRPARRSGIRPALEVARGPLVVLAILFAGLFVSDQAVDALRRWYEDFWDAVFAVAMLAWLALFVLVSTRQLLEVAAERRTGREHDRTFLLLALVVGAAAIVSLLLFEAWIGLATLAGIFLTVGVLSLLVKEPIAPKSEGRTIGSARRWLPITLALWVLLIPVLALVRAATPPIVLGDYRFFWLAAAVGAFALFGVALYWQREWLCSAWTKPTWRRVFLALTVVVLGMVVGRLVQDPWWMSEAFGAIAFLAAFLLALSLILYYLVNRAERVQPPDIITTLHLRCTPVILLVVAWIAIASVVDRETTYHDVRTMEATAAADGLLKSPVTAREAFTRWAGREEPAGKTRPLLFVAAAGGGIRAAYWTATLLTCVLEGHAPDGVRADVCAGEGRPAGPRAAAAIFAASGISGGSLGLASYVAHLRDDRRPQWPSERLDDDYASAIVGWGLFVDFPSALVRRTGGSDRAEILERALERSWDDRPGLTVGLLDSWKTQTQDSPLPVLMLSGTKVQEGCRLNVSVLDAAVERPASREAIVEDCLSLRAFEGSAPAGETSEIDKTRAQWSLSSSDDLLTYLCGPEDAPSKPEDVHLSTAVMLSARFPYALPSGRLTRCDADDVSPANVVDGGYFDTSGASPLVELWGAVARDVSVANVREGACIVPYFVQIDTGYADPVKRGDLSPSEWLIPPVTALRARSAREHNARQAAALLFSGVPEVGPSVRDRYAHIYPRAHPGVRAPLGWTLSEAAREELDGQLEQNEAEIRRVREWLTDQATDQPCGS